MAQQDDDSRIKWGVVIGSVLVAAIVGLSTAVISLGKELAAIGARQMIVLERLDRIENGAVSATSERYRLSDALRDQSKIEAMINKLEARLERIEIRRDR